MKITDTINRLIDLLIEISDSDDFVKAIVGIAGSDENRQVIIDYIEKKKEDAEEISMEQLYKIAMYLARNGTEGLKKHIRAISGAENAG